MARTSGGVAGEDSALKAACEEAERLLSLGFADEVLFKLAEDLAKMQLQVDVDEADETVVLTLTDGNIIAGRLAGQDAKALKIETIDEKGKPMKYTVIAKQGYQAPREVE